MSKLWCTFLCLNTLGCFNLTSFSKILYHYAHNYKTIKRPMETNYLMTKIFSGLITTCWNHKLICIDAVSFITIILYCERAPTALKQTCSKWKNFIYSFLMNCSLRSSCRHASLWKNFHFDENKRKQRQFLLIECQPFGKLCKDYSLLVI